jgi:Na+/melibiose symporter-like transporter
MAVSCFFCCIFNLFYSAACALREKLVYQKKTNEKLTKKIFKTLLIFAKNQKFNIIIIIFCLLP